MQPAIAARGDFFRFLDLPAELRNRIYAFAATGITDRFICLPSLGLAETCRQLRKEYLPICHATPVVLNWNNMPSYLKIVDAMTHSKLQDAGPGPASITILVDGHTAKKDEEIDILPIVKMHHRNSAFTCHFERFGLELEQEDIAEENDFPRFLNSDIVMVQELFHHSDPEWLAEVQCGHVDKIKITVMGDDEPVRVSFVVDYNEIASQREQRGRIRANQYYLEKVGMEDMFYREIDATYYVMIAVVRHKDEVGMTGMVGLTPV